MEYGYFCVYNGKKTVEKELLTPFKEIMNGKRLLRYTDRYYYGALYNNEIFLTEEEAWKSWHREPCKCFTLSEVLEMEV